MKFSEYLDSNYKGYELSFIHFIVCSEDVVGNYKLWCRIKKEVEEYDIYF